MALLYAQLCASLIRPESLAAADKRLAGWLKSPLFSAGLGPVLSKEDADGLERFIEVGESPVLASLRLKSSRAPLPPTAQKVFERLERLTLCTLAKHSGLLEPLLSQKDVEEAQLNRLISLSKRASQLTTWLLRRGQLLKEWQSLVSSDDPTPLEALRHEPLKLAELADLKGLAADNLETDGILRLLSSKRDEERVSLEPQLAPYEAVAKPVEDRLRFLLRFAAAEGIAREEVDELQSPRLVRSVEIPTGTGPAVVAFAQASIMVKDLDRLLRLQQGRASQRAEGLSALVGLLGLRTFAAVRHQALSALTRALPASWHPLDDLYVSSPSQLRPVDSAFSALLLAVIGLARDLALDSTTRLLALAPCGLSLAATDAALLKQADVFAVLRSINAERPDEDAMDLEDTPKRSVDVEAAKRHALLRSAAWTAFRLLATRAFTWAPTSLVTELQGPSVHPFLPCLLPPSNC